MVRITDLNIRSRIGLQALNRKKMIREETGAERGRYGWNETFRVHAHFCMFVMSTPFIHI